MRLFAVSPSRAGFAAVLSLLVACSKAPAPGVAAAGDAAGAPSAKPATKAEAKPFLLRIERNDARFDVSGEVPDGELPASLLERTKYYPGRTIKLQTLADPREADRKALDRIAEATPLIASGSIDVSATKVYSDAKVRTEQEKAALVTKLDEVAKLLGRELDQDIAVDAEILAPDEGFLKRPDGASIVPLKLALEPLAGGAAITPDSVGRVPAGIYKVKLGGNERYLAVAEYQTTWLPSEQQKSLGVLIGGKRFALDLDVPLVTPGDPGALDITLAKSPDEMPMYGLRYLAPGKPLKVEDVLSQRDQLAQVILHSDNAADAADAFKTDFVANSLSTHFLIDWDGTIYQLLDVGECAYHAGEANQRGIGVHLDNLAANLLDKPKASAYPKKHPRLADMQSPAFERKLGPVETINSAKVQSYGYTEAQYRSLGSLLRLLASVFPQINRGEPVDNQGKTRWNVLDDPAQFGGVLAHWHWEAQRWDPGPSFDWARLGLRDTPR